MKTITYSILIIILTLSFNACKREEGCMDQTASNYDPDAEITDGSCKYTGELMFWTTADSICGQNFITITLAGQTKNLEYFLNTPPTKCHDMGTATFSLEAGNHLVSFYDGCVTTTNTVSVIKNRCASVRLFL